MKCSILKKQTKKVNFSNDTKILDGTSIQILLFSKLILGFFKLKNYKKIDKIEDILEITKSLDILEFCIKESFILINNLLEKEVFKSSTNEYLIVVNNTLSESIQLLSGQFYSKILYPNGNINYVIYKFPLYYNNENNNIEIDWDHIYFYNRVNKYKNNNRIPLILKGSRDIKDTIGINCISELRNFINLLKNAHEFILSLIENDFK